MNHRELNQQAFLEAFKHAFKDKSLRELCFNLKINYEDLAGATFSERAISLYEHCQETRRLSDLIDGCETLRPGTNWRGFSSPDSPKESSSEPPQAETLAPELQPLPGENPTKHRLGWIVVAVSIAVVALAGAGALGWYWRDARGANAMETTPSPTQMVEVTRAEPVTQTMARAVDLPLLANIKERVDFELGTSLENLADWSMSFCNTDPCQYTPASDSLVVAQEASGNKSLQFVASMESVRKVYTLEYRFPLTKLDGLSANIYVPNLPDDDQTLAAEFIYLQVHLQEGAGKIEWQRSILRLEESGLPGWYQVFIDLRQVANEERQAYSTLHVDRLHIDLILPSVEKSQQVTFLIDDIVLYSNLSSHDLDWNIPPLGLMAEETVVTSPTGDGIIFDFEHGEQETDNWSASDDQGTQQPIALSNDMAYDGAYSLSFVPRLEEWDGNRGDTFCLAINGREVPLQNRLIISRLYIPDDVPYNLSVRYHLTGQDFYPSWSNEDENNRDRVKHGGWNTFVWYTADAEEWQETSNLELCIYLTDRGEENKYPEDGKEPASFYLDSVEIIPYEFTYLDERTLDPVRYYSFVSDELPSIVPADTPVLTATSGITLADGDIYALQLDVDLPPDPNNGNLPESGQVMQLDLDGERIEALVSMINFPGTSENALSVTLEGILSNGDVIRQTFPLSPGTWTPIFWPTRGNDFDESSLTEKMERVSIYLSSPEGYVGPVYVDYLALYRRLPEQ